MVATLTQTAPADDSRFSALAAQFLDVHLQYNPEAATTLGDHRFDGTWTDYSAAGSAVYLQKLSELRAQLRQVDRGQLGSENQVDYDILLHHLDGQLWSWGQLQEHRWNPLTFNPGAGLYPLVARDFAPLPQRLQSLAERLERLPRLLEQACTVLERPPALHCQTAIQQNQGSISFIRQELQGPIELSGPLRPRLEAARRSALTALEEYGKWLEGDLLPKADRNFRIGDSLYRQKLHYALESSLDVGEVGRRAEADLKATQAEMASVARQLYPRLVGSSPDGLADSVVCRQVLSKVADQHPTSSTILPQATASLARTSQFVREQKLVSLPTEACEVIEMPEFYRGVAVAYCDSPGPLEGSGKTFYAIAPTPSDWSEQRTLSFYREYNNAMLEDLTVHEAMPGHFLQLMHANRFKAPTRVRAVLQSGTFVEGWATYAEQVMAQAGYGGPEVHLQQLKMRLRLILNALLDQRVHCGSLSESEAVAWLQREGFQEEGEATGKWKRACLTSAQLSTYYVGNCEVNDLARDYRRLYPSASLQQMHDHMLSYGSPAPRYLRVLLKL